MTPVLSFADVSDHQLLLDVTRLAAAERQATAQLIACLAEVDARRLYLGEGCSSLFTYCTHVVRLSEHAAYGRIEAARAARRFPVVLDLLSRGDSSEAGRTVPDAQGSTTRTNHRLSARDCSVVRSIARAGRHGSGAYAGQH